jgi:hypothetical protein
MILTTPGLTQSINNGWPVRGLVAIDHPIAETIKIWPDGVMRMWDGVGTLRHDGHDWLGMGIYGRMTGVGGSKQLTLRSVTFELTGIPASYDIILDERIRNRSAQAWIAGMDADGSWVNGEPYLEVDGLCDYSVHKTEENGTQTIQLFVGQPVFSIERAQNKLYTSEWLNDWLSEWRDLNVSGQRLTGFDKIPELANAVRSWTKT